MTGPLFPAAARPADDPHPPSCPCLPCIDALIAEVSKPVVLPAPRTDPAAADRKQPAYGDWLANRPAPGGLTITRAGPEDPAQTERWERDKPEANRATRGPGTGGGAGRRPSGPGRRRGGGGVGGEGAPGGCASAFAALLALAVIALAAAAGLVWLAAH